MRTVTLLLIASLSSLLSFAQANVGGKKDYKEIGAPMPPLKLVIPLDVAAASLYGTDSVHKTPIKTKYFSNKDLSKKQNAFIMLFNPTCEHCQDQARMFKDSVHLFTKKGNKVVFVAGDMMMAYLEYFDSGTKISTYPGSFIMGVDSSRYIDNLFTYQMLPQINIYSKTQKLLKVFNGGVPMDSLRAYLK